MTSSGTTTKYNTSTSNLLNRRQGGYTSTTSTSGNNYLSSTKRRPYQKYNTVFEDTDGEDEKKLLSLSERIKKLSTSRVLKDSSKLTHNNNEPFTYLRTPTSTITPININDRGRKIEKLKPAGREVIYAQVVVDPDDRNYMNNQSNIKNKRTVHRSYNNNTYESSSSGNKMKGRNVTTVLLNSSSDDIPSSVNIDERMGSNSRFRSSSSPLLATNDDYYPKSPGIVLRQQQFQNGYNTSNRSRYENHLQRKSNDYMQSDDDNYFGTRTSTKYRSNVNSDKYGYEYQEQPLRDRSPFPKDITDYSNNDDFYDYQPLNYNKNSSAPVISNTNTSFMDSYSKSSAKKMDRSYRFDEEDEYDVTRNTKFEDRRSQTLDRTNSFSNNNRLSEFNRSRTLDNRISYQKDKGGPILEEDIIIDPKGIKHGEPMNFKVTTTTKKEQGATVLNNKSKSSGSSNLFSTLLRRNNNNKKVDQKSSETILSNNTKTNIKSNDNSSKKTEKKSGQPSTNFFTSFLEKKRRNKQQSNSDLMKKSKGQSQTQKADNNTSSTYQSYNNWPPPAPPPPTFSVVDYSDPLLSTSNKHYYGENNVDSNTEDSIANASDIWKKSYGTDLTKVKRRWTMREPSKPSVIREEDDLATRTLGRKTSYLGVSPRLNSIDRRSRSNYSLERDGHSSYDINSKKYFGGENSSPKVSSRNKYSTIESRSRYSQEKGYQPQKYDDYDPTTTTGYSNNNTLTKRGRQTTSSSNNKLSSKGYTYGGGFVGGGTPNSSGSESNRNNNNLLNGSLRSVYLHEAAVIPEMPRTTASSGGGGASISGLSGRRTLSKDEISNYSGPRKETKQLSRSMSIAHPWGPSKHYKDRYKELDYSHTNNLLLPPRPPSRSPSGTGSGLNYRPSPSGTKPGETNAKRQQQSKQYSSNRLKPPMTASNIKNTKKNVSSSSVESLLRQDTPDEGLLKRKGNSKLGRSKSISAPGGITANSKDGKNNRFSTLWFKKNHNK